MIDPLRAQRRQLVANVADARIAQQAATILGEVERDIGIPGRGQLPPKLKSVFELPKQVIDQVLAFDIQAAELDLKRIQADGAVPVENPFSRDYQDQLLARVHGCFSSLVATMTSPSGGRPRLQALLAHIPGVVEGLRRGHEAEYATLVELEYGHKRDDFDLERARLGREMIAASSAQARGPRRGPARVHRRPASTRQKKALEQRNKWIYQQCCNGVPYKSIVAELKKLGPQKGWPLITSKQGIQAAATRYAEGHGHEKPAPRQNL
jgi:hypothetical protein